MTFKMQLILKFCSEKSGLEGFLFVCLLAFVFVFVFLPGFKAGYFFFFIEFIQGLFVNTVSIHCPLFGGSSIASPSAQRRAWRS